MCDAACRVVSGVRRGMLILLILAVSGQTDATLLFAQATTVDQVFPPGIQVGQTTVVKAGGKHDGQSITWRSNCAGLSFAAGEKPGEVKVTAAADAKPGVYLLQAVDSVGASRLLPFVVDRLSEFQEAEPNNKWTEATPFPEGTMIAAGATANGVLAKRGDVDHFAVRLEAGQTLIAALEANALLDSPMDALLQVLSPTGVVLEMNHDDRGLDPLIVFQATEAGTYFVRVMAYPSQPDASIGFSGGPTYQYRLLLTAGPVVSHRLPVARGAAARAGKLFGWNIPAGQEAITLAPANEPESDLGFPVLARLHRYPADVGLAKIVVEGEEPAATLLEALPLGYSGTISSAGEKDEFRVSAPKGATLRIRVLAREFDSYLDPVLQVVDAAGKVLKETDDENRNEWDIDTTVAVPEGPVTLRVFDRFDKGGARYFYHVDVRTDAADFALTTTTFTKALKPGETSEIKVAVTRRGTIAEPIVISAEGLPAGVSVAPVKSEAKGDSAKEVTVVFVVAADAVPAAGPIRIVGQVEGQAAFTRTMTLPRVGVFDALTEFWLTVAPK